MDITVGVLKQIIDGEEPVKPIVQVLGFKAIEKKGDQTERYRVLLSDGKYQHSSCMLGTQLNPLVASQDVQATSLVQLEKYICNCLNKQTNKYVIIILDMKVLKKQCLKLGDPKQLTTVFQEGEAATNCNITAAASANNDSAQKRPANKNDISEGNHASKQSKRTNVMLFQDKDMSNCNIFTIDSLNPYQSKWTIKARVTNKMAPRTWSNSRGEGKLFSFDIIDNSGEMRVTAFNEQCERYCDTIEVNKIYFISRGSIKPANRKFSSIQNDYEMTLNMESTVLEATGLNEQDTLPTIAYNFISIKDIAKIENNKIIDVIGVAKSASNLQTIITKATNKEISKRDVVLVDESATISLTLWGSQAEDFELNEPKVVAMKGVRVTDFSGRSLSVLNSTGVALNPDIPEQKFLMAWYEREGANLSDLQSLSNGRGGDGGQTMTSAVVKHLGEVRLNNLTSDVAEYFNIKASIIGTKKETALYQSCATQDCNKKVTDQGDGTYRCEKCNRTNEEFKWRFIMQVNISDFADSQWVTCFNDVAEAMIKRSAEEMGRYKQEGNQTEYEDAFRKSTFVERMLRVRTKIETYNDERRVKLTCVSMAPVDYVQYGNQVLQSIQKMLEH